METGSIYYALLGGYFVLVGLLMIVFHRQGREMQESMHHSLPEVITRFWPRGRLLSIFIVGFGALSLLGGLGVLLVNFGEP